MKVQDLSGKLLRRVEKHASQGSAINRCDRPYKSAFVKPSHNVVACLGAKKKDTEDEGRLNKCIEMTDIYKVRMLVISRQKCPSERSGYTASRLYLLYKKYTIMAQGQEGVEAGLH